MTEPEGKNAICTVVIPVPVPQIKQFSRWRVFCALFNPKAHFTTCDTLVHQCYTETAQYSNRMIDRFRSGRSII